MRTQIRIRERFCAGLSLRDPRLTEDMNRRHFGRWMELHGHDFTIEVTVEGPVDSNTHCIVDYTKLHRLVQREIIRHVDHHTLNEVDILRDVVPTSENQARVYFELLAAALPRGAHLVSLSVEDADGNAAIVMGE